MDMRCVRRRRRTVLTRKGKFIMKRLGIIVILVGISTLVMTLIGAYAQSRNAPKPTPRTASGHELPNCPVGGQPINLAVSTATDDGPVFFCCSGCIKKFKADPKKLAGAVADQRKALAALPRVQVTCPVSGEPVKTDVFIRVKGNKVQFCCRNCRAKYEKDPAKYGTNLTNIYTYQMKCPVTGKPIDAQVSAEAPAGEIVFFCCKDCPDKFRMEPERFSPKLEEQGFRLDLATRKP